MTKTTFFLGVLLACAAVPVAFSQQTAPASSANSGPSLAVTMQFIQDKLNDIGKVSLANFYRSNDGSTFSYPFTNEVSNVVADPGHCRIAYHWKTTSNGTTQSDTDGWILLHDVQDIVVMPYAQNQAKVDARNYVTTSPPLTDLLVRKPHGVVVNVFPFSDPQLAGRVAKAMVHAVELCGGGNKDPF